MQSSSKNSCSIKISSETFKTVRHSLNQVNSVLQPCFSNINPDEGCVHKKNTERLIKFLEQTHSMAVVYPDLFPNFIGREAFREDFAVAKRLWKLSDQIEQLQTMVDSAEVLALFRVLDHAQAFYQTLKIAARRDIPAARMLFDELKPLLPSKALTEKMRYNY